MKASEAVVPGQNSIKDIGIETDVASSHTENRVEDVGGSQESGNEISHDERWRRITLVNLKALMAATRVIKRSEAMLRGDRPHESDEDE